MSIGAWMMVLVALVTVATLTFLVFSMVRSIQNERSPDRSVADVIGPKLAPTTPA
ncbi:MAG TPA: hypothetical protein VHO00_02465 [Actinomycetes bacterium]|jgi:hypothetical protein|nr:hypothetical protein [Actinomycetes bacterium]